ncbi:MAG TPA: 6-bladed beta-propeller, partial [Phototrophicaceae bacterium]|nr:6-bladed beta-propeller [Phototrophicaceae bacterium]
ANALEDLSLRTTNGYDLKFAYDDKMSWPGVWYFRQYDKNIYMGKNPTLQQMEGAAVVLVGEANRSVVEPLLEDRYQRFEYSRMWWPMMDYFNLTAQRIVDTFYLGNKDTPVDSTQPSVDKSAQIRRGLFDIWWNRDYTTYGEAMGKDFSLSNWPVQEKMYMYVRKDIAASVWLYGTGDGSLSSVVENTEPISACVSNWIQPNASVVFNTSNAGLKVPIGLSVAPDGTVYVADGADETSRLAKFNAQTGEFISTFGQTGGGDAVGAFFTRPNGVRVAADGTIYVVDTWNYKIRSFTASGEPITSWGQPLTVGFDAPQQPADGFWGPRDVDVDSAGNVYVADTGNKRVRVYTSDGQFIRDIGSGGSGLGQLDEPSGIAISKDGRLFVADTWNRRISVFNTIDGSFLTSYSLKAWYDVGGSRPYLAIDPNRPVLYVTDPEGGRILVLNLDGTCLGAFGRPNRDNPNAGEFSTLGGIAVDQSGNVYVVDTGTGRILRFDPFPLDASQLANSVDIPLLPESSEEVVATEEVQGTEEAASTEEAKASTEESVAGTEEVNVEKTAEVQATEETQSTQEAKPTQP